MPSSEQFSKSRPIYLDYHSTTPVDRLVTDCIYHYMTEEFGQLEEDEKAIAISL